MVLHCFNQQALFGKRLHLFIGIALAWLTLKSSCFSSVSPDSSPLRFPLFQRREWQCCARVRPPHMPQYSPERARWAVASGDWNRALHVHYAQLCSTSCACKGTCRECSVGVRWSNCWPILKVYLFICSYGVLCVVLLNSMGLPTRCGQSGQRIASEHALCLALALWR